MEITLTLGELITYGGILIAAVGAYWELKHRSKQNSKDILRLENAIEKIVTSNGNQELRDQTIGTWQKRR